MSQCVVGSSAEEVDDEEEDNESVESGAPAVLKEGCYQIMGTVKDKTTRKPDFVKEIFEVISSTIFS